MVRRPRGTSPTPTVLSPVGQDGTVYRVRPSTLPSVMGVGRRHCPPPPWPCAHGDNTYVVVGPRPSPDPPRPDVPVGRPRGPESLDVATRDRLNRHRVSCLPSNPLDPPVSGPSTTPVGRPLTSPRLRPRSSEGPSSPGASLPVLPYLGDSGGRRKTLTESPIHRNPRVFPEI